MLSSTCKHCWNKCGIQTFNITKEFEQDNRYWRENFFNFFDPSQDSTLFINDNKFELLTDTQRRQFKYYIRYWDKFIIERQNRKKQRDDLLFQNGSDVQLKQVMMESD